MRSRGHRPIASAVGLLFDRSDLLRFTPIPPNPNGWANLLAEKYKKLVKRPAQQMRGRPSVPAGPGARTPVPVRCQCRANSVDNWWAILPTSFSWASATSRTSLTFSSSEAETVYPLKP